jgi:outer membrane immunogenic protein
VKKFIAVTAAIAAVGFVSSASAADMPTKAFVLKAPVAVAPSWTGFYVGANIGAGWGSRSIDSFTANDSATAALFGSGSGGTPPAASFRSSGLTGGLQIGYNWQFNRNWLVGLEADFDWSGMKGSSSSNFTLIGLPFVSNLDERIKWFGTVRARLGYLPTDNLLAYVTGGLAYGRVDRSGSYVDNSGIGVVFGAVPFVTCNPNASCLTGSNSSTASGWTLGGGLEYQMWQHVTLKAEYLYVSLPGTSVTEYALVSIGGTSSFTANYGRANFNVARVGLNYQF